MKNRNVPIKSMRNIKLTIEYDGTHYFGWQVQNVHKFKTIQQAIEKALQRILHRKVGLIASGRTDSGVHAKEQIANFKTSSSITTEKLRGALNALLPDDIAVVKIEEAEAGFHSRFCAKSKIYRYIILNRPSRPAILRDMVYYLSYPLDLKLMRKEAKALLGRHNFKSFQATEKKIRSSIRTIKDIKISKEGDLINIDIEADGFLYNMVRSIVGTLIDIGRGQLPKGSMRKILLAKNRRYSGQTVPSSGLCLLKVKY